VLWFRLGRLGLGPGPLADRVEAAAAPASDFMRFGAMQALSARTNGLTREAYETAVDDGRLVRAHTLRAAIHVQRPEDFALFGRTLIARDDEELARQMGTPARKLLAGAGIPANEALDEVTAATEAALAGGTRLTKDGLHEELRSTVRRELMPWCKGCGSHHVAPMLWRFASVSAGARRDAEGHYLIGRPKPKGKPSPADALRRFLALYGPANLADFLAWSSLPQATGTRVWEEVSPELADLEWSGGAGSLPPEDLAALEDAAEPQGVLLLAANDPYLAQPDRGSLVPDPALRKRLFRPVASPGTVLLDGRIAGVWRARAKGRRLSIEIEELEHIPRRRIAPEIERIAALREAADVEVSWS